MFCHMVLGAFGAFGGLTRGLRAEIDESFPSVHGGASGAIVPAPQSKR